jgi:hypothetical protein
VILNICCILINIVINVDFKLGKVVRFTGILLCANLQQLKIRRQSIDE